MAGDPFDPALHEAVIHDTSAEVSVPTATTVLRQGYRRGDRVLRTAMVAVTDPESPGGTGRAGARHRHAGRRPRTAVRRLTRTATTARGGAR